MFGAGVPYRVAVVRPQLPPPPLLDAGWYPDPTGRYEARYWDGRKWSSHISHYGATGSDPVLRARFDFWWLRAAFRLAMWGLVILAGFWAYDRFWPTDDRDLEADAELARTAVVNQQGLPAGWTPDARTALSPLSLEVVDGEVVPATCEPFVGIIDDAADEPVTVASWASADKVRGVAEELIVWADADPASRHLEELREPEAGPCLGELWVAALAEEERRLTVTAAQPQIDPSFGDEALWWRLVGQIESGLPLDLYTDVLVVRVDRVVVTYRFASTLEPVAVDVQRNVIAAHVGQIQLLLAAMAFEADDGGDTDTDTDPDAPAGDDAPADGVVPAEGAVPAGTDGTADETPPADTGAGG